MHPFGMFASFLLLDCRSTKSRNSEPDLPALLPPPRRFSVHLAEEPGEPLTLAIQLTLKRNHQYMVENRTGGPGESSGRSAAYLQKLRVGAKHVIQVDSVLSSLATITSAKEAYRRELEAVQSSAVVVHVQTQAELEKLELWQQGDASLATKEKMLERQKLRYDRRVLEMLQQFWEAALR